MKLAAIDIGSNAIRLQISRVLWDDDEQPIFKKLESIRFPLRLGKDVFRTGEISFRSETRFIDLMTAFRTLIDIYDVDDAFGCATSAMRDADNGKRILDRAYDKSGLHIELISGDEEAALLDRAVHNIVGTGHYMNIDVGGGSSEVNFSKDGTSYARRSFKLGSVRNMQNRDKAETWEEFESWIKENQHGKVENVIGTGGNIGSIHKLAGVPVGEDMTLEQIIEVYEDLIERSMIYRVQQMGLREDRADVITHGAEIYMKAMVQVDCNRMVVPNVGLKDGIIEMLYERNM
jgi:exopolyphosphatase/guanosine-5'-triphosphate,3'-diphosphate pyrophosphatase